MGLDNPLHIAFLVVILLLLFGARRLPEIGRSLGTGMREFKDSITGGGSQAQQQALPPATQSTAQSAPAPQPVAAAPQQAPPQPAQQQPAPSEPAQHA